MINDLVEITLLIEQGEVNGYQATEWHANGQLILTTSTTQALPEQLEFKTTMPCQITVNVSGKNMGQDTRVIDGQIVQDKYVKIKGILLARLPVKDFVLYRVCRIVDDQDNTHNTNYWHCNGQASITFDAPTPVVWHLTQNY